MFNPHQRRIAHKKHVWDMIRNGELMRLTIDLETTGVGRQKVPYRTPNYAYPTEWGDCLTDFAGNYLNSAQILYKLPENTAFEVPALTLQRVRDMGPELFDSPDRLPFGDGMAAAVWRIKQSAYAYEEMAQQFGDKKKPIHITDFNKQFTGGQKAATEEVYDIPLLDDNGRIVYDARYHPDRRKVSYRFSRHDEDGTSQDYRGENNLYYYDEADKSYWKWVDAGISPDGFNFNRYDMPILRSALYRAGFSSANTTMLYSRATLTNKQQKKPHGVDVRDLAMMTALYGDQGEKGLKLGALVDETGRVRGSEALGAYHDKNMGQAIPGRLLRGGPFDPRDGSYFDLKLAHGAVADAAATAALRNLCWDIAPDVAALLYRQSDEKTLYETLMAQSPKGDTLPLFFMPRRENGLSHTDLPYWFLGGDDQIGRFKQLLFLKVDGTLHKEKFNGRHLNELSTEEFMDYLKLAQERRDPDRCVRIESKNRWGGAYPAEDRLQGAGPLNRHTSIEDMLTDIRFILENSEMCQKIVQAQAVRNHNLRFDSKVPQNELLEDALGRKYGGEVYYQEEECALESRKMWHQSGGAHGAEKIDGILETIRGRMNDDYKYFMTSLDEALSQLTTMSHMIDLYRDLDLRDPLHESVNPEGRMAAEVLRDFKELAERVYAKFKEKKWPYRDVLGSIVNPVTKEPYFKGTKFCADSVAQAYDFRKQLGLRALNDFDKLFQFKTPPAYLTYTGQDFCQYEWKGKPLLLFADADNGQNGAPPHVVNENGIEIPLETIKGLNRHIDFKSGSNQAMRSVLDNLIETKRWRYRFYRDRTEPGIMLLAHRFAGQGMAGKVPRSVRLMYVADAINRLEGMTNEDLSTDRIPTLRTMKESCKAIRAALTVRDPRILERDPVPELTAAFKALKPEEALQRLAWIEGWIEKKEKFVEARKAELAEEPGSEAVRRTAPESGLPYDFIPITIPRDSAQPMESDPNFILMDVPVWHMRNPIEQEDDRLPRKFLVVPPLKNSFKSAANNRSNPKPVILRGMEDARLAAVSRSDLLPLREKKRRKAPLSRITAFDPADPSLADIWEKVRNDYRAAGIELDPAKKLWALEIEDIYPLAGTRRHEKDMPSIKLPRLHFDALVAPRYANTGDEPLHAVLIPHDYFPQTVKPGDKIRLRQMDTDMWRNIYGETDAVDLGHSYESVVTHVFCAPRDEFIRKAAQGRIEKEFLKAAGFAGGNVQHLNQVLDGLVTDKWKDNPGKMPLVLVAFERVNETYFKNGRQEKDNSYAYHPLTGAPDAALQWNGVPVSPLYDR